MLKVLLTTLDNHHVEFDTEISPGTNFIILLAHKPLAILDKDKQNNNFGPVFSFFYFLKIFWGFFVFIL